MAKSTQALIVFWARGEIQPPLWGPRPLMHLTLCTCLCLIFAKEVLTWSVLVGRLSNSKGNALPYKNQEDSISLIEHLADALNTVSTSFCIRWLFFRDFALCQGEFYFCILAFSSLWPSGTSAQPPTSRRPRKWLASGTWVVWLYRQNPD